MRSKYLIACFIVALGIHSCGKGRTSDEQNDREGDRANELGVQGTEIEENSNSSETSGKGRTDPKEDSTSKSTGQ